MYQHNASVITVELFGLERTAGARRLHGLASAQPHYKPAASPKAPIAVMMTGLGRHIATPLLFTSHGQPTLLDSTAAGAHWQWHPSCSVTLDDAWACLHPAEQGLRLQRRAAGAAGAANRQAGHNSRQQQQDRSQQPLGPCDDHASRPQQPNQPRTMPWMIGRCAE